jgi:hypothetical protein
MFELSHTIPSMTVTYDYYFLVHMFYFTHTQNHRPVFHMVIIR